MFPKVVVSSLAFTLMVLFLCNVRVSDALECYKCTEWFHGKNACGENFDPKNQAVATCKPEESYCYSYIDRDRPWLSFSELVVYRGCTSDVDHCKKHKGCQVCEGDKCNTKKHEIE